MEITNTLVVGDLHLPFEKEGYFDHCDKIYSKHNCDNVIFIGDIVDQHFSSFHVTDPDGLGGADELDAAIDQLKKWYARFPEAIVILGNHDRIVTRKAKMANLPSKWIKEYNDVLETPGWDWKVEHIQGDTLFQHGEGGSARGLVKHYGMNVVGGHRHSEFYLEYSFGPTNAKFAMQVGCGVDRNSYALEYARSFKHQAIGCGVVSTDENGYSTAYIEPMKL